MQRNSSFCCVLLAFSLTLLPNAVRADETQSVTPHSYAGLQALTIVGVHRDIAGSQYGVGAGPLAQVHVGGQRLAVHLEGIPVVSIPNTRPSAHYGQATPKLGIFNGQIEYALNDSGRAWVGVGTTIYNQRTPLPNLQQEVSSRLAGARYTMRYRMPLTPSHFVEGLVGVAPALFGSDHYEYSDGITPAVDKAERASEVDASLAYGWDRNTSEWLVGLRMLNFSAEFVQAGDAADRNVGIGVMLEWRHLIRR
jgi:hypothetical protein